MSTQDTVEYRGIADFGVDEDILGTPVVGVSHHLSRGLISTSTARHRPAGAFSFT